MDKPESSEFRREHRGGSGGEGKYRKHLPDGVRNSGRACEDRREAFIFLNE